MKRGRRRRRRRRKKKEEEEEERRRGRFTYSGMCSLLLYPRQSNRCIFKAQ